MYLRNLAVVTLVALVMVSTVGCFRGPRLRTSRGYSGYSSSSRQPKPEEMKIGFRALDARSLKVLSDARAKWATYCEKYDATGLSGAAQVTAVVGAFNNAHWSERPSPEDFAQPLGVAIGDTLKAQGNVDWVVVDGYICLVSPNGKVAVTPVATAKEWLKAKKHPIDELIQYVADAIRETTGEPVLVGLDEDEEDSGTSELR
jgi:hypothetical protein